MFSGRWHFPEDTSIQVKGVTSTKFDSSKNELDTVVRELCQNSSDASLGGVVRIEFERFKIPTNQFPDKAGFEKVIELCTEAASQYKHDSTTTNVFKGMAKTLQGEELTIMRCSDFGTTGAIGSRITSPTENSPWKSLTIGKGISDKGRNSGGSFGRGKESFFLSSKLRTVFFSTLDCEGNSASIGCSDLITHYENDQKRDSFGICGDSEFKHNYSVPETLSFGSFKRNPGDYGTDVYIMAYEDDGNAWEDLVLITVAKEFFIKIINGELEVSAGHKELNASNIESKILMYAEEYPAHADVLSLVSEQISAYHHNKVYGDEIFEIYLKKSDKYSAVSSVRSGMVIQNNYSNKSGVVGVLNVVDPDISKLLTKSEDAAHSQWYKRRITNATADEKEIIIQYLNKFQSVLNDEINKIKEYTENDYINAEGIEKYLSYTTESPEQIKISRKEYSWNPTISTKTKKRRKVIKKQYEESPGDAMQELNAIEVESDEFNPSGSVDQKENPREDNPRNFIPGEGDMKRKFLVLSSIKMLDLVPLCNPSDEGIECTFIFDINKETEYFLKFESIMSDEKPAEAIAIISVKDAAGNDIPLYDEYHAGPILSKRGHRNKLTVILDYPGVCNVRPGVLEHAD